VGTTQNCLAFLSASRLLVAVLAFGIALIVWAGYRASIADVRGMLTLGLPGEHGRHGYEVFVSRMSSPEFYAGLVIVVLASIFFAVRWHRYILLGETASPPFSSHRHYVWVLVKVALVYALFSYALMYVGFIWPTHAMVDFATQHSISLAFVGMAGVALRVLRGVVSSAVSMRLWLVLPDAALTGRRKVFATFMASQGNTWRLVICYFAIHICRVASFIALCFLCGVVPAASLESYGKLEGAIAFSALFVFGLPLYLYLLMLEVGLVSVAYREIIGLPGNEKDELAPAPAQDTPSPA